MFISALIKRGLHSSHKATFPQKGKVMGGIISDLLQGRREKINLDLLQEPQQETKAEIVWHGRAVRFVLITRGLE